MAPDVVSVTGLDHVLPESELTTDLMESLAACQIWVTTEPSVLANSVWLLFPPASLVATSTGVLHVAPESAVDVERRLRAGLPSYEVQITVAFVPSALPADLESPVLPLLPLMFTGVDQVAP